MLKNKIAYVESLRASGLSSRIIDQFKERYSIDVNLEKTKVDNMLSDYRKHFEAPQPLNRNIAKLVDLFPKQIKTGKVLIVGLGLSVTYVWDFFELGADVWGVEPNIPYFDIQKKNFELINIPPEQVLCAYAENLPFEDGAFDFVFCYTVIEHVQDLGKSLSEMYRVTKEGGVIFLETPDYRIPQEPHYKLQFPFYIPIMSWLYSKMPSIYRKSLVALVLRFQGRSTEFLKTLTFLDARTLRNIFYSNGWSFFEACFPPDLTKPGNVITQSMMKLDISRNYYCFITK